WTSRPRPGWSCRRRRATYTRPTMTVTEERQETAPAKRISAARVLRWVGILGAASTAMLGVIGSLQEHPHFEIAREVFGNIPDAIVVVFYVVISAFVGLMFFLFARRAEVWQQGQADRRVGQWGERIRRLVNGLAMRTVMRDRRAGIMHSAIYWGFDILFLGTDRKSTRLNSSHVKISYAVFCLKKKKNY